MSKICAHRGMLNIKPENTISSFKEALKYDIDGIELDVHLTKDEKIVVFHDFDLKRICNNNSYIKDLTYEELKEIKVNDIEPIPQLFEVLELIKNKNIILNIELKASSEIYSGIEEKVLNLINDYNIKDKIIISSFDHRALKIVKDIDKEIKVGALYQGFFDNIVKYAVDNKFDAIHPHFLDIDKKIVKEAKENNIKINCYTINNMLAYNYIKHLDVDMIITNIADKILKRGNK